MSQFASFPAKASFHWKSPVANLAALPATGNASGDVRVALDTGFLYEWTGSAWQQVSGGGGGGGVTTLTAVGSAPNANGGVISGTALTLEPADSTHPGLVTALAQTFGGVKSFSTDVEVVGTLIADGAVSGNSNGTLDLNGGILSYGSGAAVDFTLPGFDDQFGNTSVDGNDRTLNNESGNPFVSWANSQFQVGVSGSIATITSILQASATLSFGAIAAGGAVSNQTITVSNAQVGDVVQLGLPATVDAGMVYTAWVSATGTVTVRGTNVKAVGSITPATASFNVIVTSVQ